MEVLPLDQQKKAVLYAPKDLLWKIAEEEDAWLKLLGILPEDYYNQFLSRLRLLGVADAGQMKNMAKVYVQNKVRVDHLQEAVAAAWSPSDLEDGTSWLKENGFLNRPLAPLSLQAKTEKEAIFFAPDLMEDEPSYDRVTLFKAVARAFADKLEEPTTLGVLKVLQAQGPRAFLPKTSPAQQVKELRKKLKLRRLTWGDLQHLFVGRRGPSNESALPSAGDDDVTLKQVVAEAAAMPKATRLRLARAAKGARPKVGNPPDGASPEAAKCWNSVLRDSKRKKMIFAPKGVADQWALAHKFWLRECAEKGVPAYKSPAASSSMHAQNALKRSYHEMHNSLCYDGYTMSRPASRLLRKLYDQLVQDGYDVGPWNPIRPKTPKGI
jgi:hypothetical protein